MTIKTNEFENNNINLRMNKWICTCIHKRTQEFLILSLNLVDTSTLCGRFNSWSNVP